MYYKNISEENANKISYHVYKDGQVIVEQMNNVYEKLVECNKKLIELEKIKEIEEKHLELIKDVKSLISKIDGLYFDLENKFNDGTKKLNELSEKIIKLYNSNEHLKNNLNFDEIQSLLKTNFVKLKSDIDNTSNQKQEIKDFIISTFNEQSKSIDSKIYYIKDIVENNKDNKYVINLFFIIFLINLLILFKLFF